MLSLHRFLLVSILSCGALAVLTIDARAAAFQLLISPDGESVGDRFGGSVGTAGDVNGDGYADVIVGAFLNDAGGSNAGKAYVFYGGPGVDTVPDLVFTGESSGDEFGASVGTAGDVNGDGYDDLIVGAGFNDAGGSAAGRAYVFYGGPGADTVPDLIFTGEVAYDNFGVSVGTAGDVNGDGYADVIVGAYDAAAGSGRAYVYFGGAAADTMADLIFTGNGNRFGFSVGTAGDANGDGYADLIVGEYSNTGAAYVYFGGPGADAVADLTLSGSANGGGNFGHAVGTAGDVNGDGFADVIVGAFSNSAGGNGAGRAFVFYGGSVADTTADLTFTGEAPLDYFGYAVGTAGDVNGDGYADLIVGTEPYDAMLQPGAGKAYIFLGGPWANSAADLTFTGGDGDQLGISVGTAGDVDGDGSADVIVGAYLAWIPLHGRPGEAYVYSISEQLGVGESPVAPGLRFLTPRPNPALGSTSLTFELERATTITLEAFDSRGRLVDRPIRSEHLPEGVTTRIWRPRRLGSGVYYLRARVGERAEVRKLLWLGSR